MVDILKNVETMERAIGAQRKKKSTGSSKCDQVMTSLPIKPLLQTLSEYFTGSDRSVS